MSQSIAMAQSRSSEYKMPLFSAGRAGATKVHALSVMRLLQSYCKNHSSATMKKQTSGLQVCSAWIQLKEILPSGMNVLMTQGTKYSLSPCLGSMLRSGPPGSKTLSTGAWSKIQRRDGQLRCSSTIRSCSGPKLQNKRGARISSPGSQENDNDVKVHLNSLPSL